VHKKILFLIGHFGIGGKERQLVEMILGLEDSRYELFLFMKSSNQIFINKIDRKIKEIQTLNLQNFNIFNIIELNKFVNRIEPDIIFSLSKTTSHFALIIKLLFKKNYRLINASIRNAPKTFNMYLKIERFLYNIYKDVVANSYSGLLAYNQLGKSGRHILHNGFDMNRVPTDSKIKLRLNLGLQDKFTVIMIGSMSQRKDQLTFIKAASMVLNNGSNFQFILIGDGPKKLQYQNLIKKLNINSQVIILSEVDNVESYFKASDISVLTSASHHGEGIANVILESMACGTPVIASDNGGTREILKHKYNGLMIKNGDFEILAKKITFLKDHPDMLNYFSTNGVKTVRNCFSTERMISGFESIINDSNNNFMT